MITLKQTIRALGYTREAEQRAAVKLLQSAGALGMPQEPLLDDVQATALLEQGNIPTPELAAQFLQDAAARTEGDPAMEVLGARIKQLAPTLSQRIAYGQNVRQVTDGMVAIRPSALETDADKLQFRQKYDAKGVTKEGRSTGEWNPLSDAESILALETLDGKLKVINGHHRTARAQELNAQGKGPEWLAARVIRESDGYNLATARAIGAFENVAQGHVNTLETALALRDSQKPDVRKDLLPTVSERVANRPAMKDAIAVAKLDDASFEMVKKGDVPAEAAAVIATQVKDPAEQRTHLSTVKRILAERAVKSAAERVASVESDQSVGRG